MNRNTADMLMRLHDAGISTQDALALRRISMTLQNWFAAECGDSNDHGSWAIVRGKQFPDMEGGKRFEHDDDGDAFMKRHHYMHGRGKDSVSYSKIPDREKGARKRLAAILAKYPGMTAYVQGDPRGAALYILRPGNVPEGQDVSAYYTRGLCVFK